MIQLEKSNIALIFIAFTVIAAGCTDTQDTETASSTAVEVVNFSVTPSTIYDNQQTSLRMTLRNVGDAEATDVKAEMFDLTMGGERGWEVQDKGDFDLGDLRPADPDSGIEARDYQEVKTMTPPNLMENENIPYPVATRIMFGYETSASTEVQIMSERRFRETGATFSRPSVQNSDAPIQLEVQTRTPIEYRGEDVTHDLRVVARNQGDGTPYLGDDFREDEDKVRLSVSATQDITLEPKDGDNVAELVGGTRGFQTYEISGVDFDPQDDTQVTVPITITADYNYYKEDQTTVTVKGTRDSQQEPEEGEWQFKDPENLESPYDSVVENAIDEGISAEEYCTGDYDDENQDAVCEQA